MRWRQPEERWQKTNCDNVVNYIKSACILVITGIECPKLNSSKLNNLTLGILYSMEGGGSLLAHTECDFEHACKVPDGEQHVLYQLKALDHMVKKQMQITMKENGLDFMSPMNIWIIEYMKCNEDSDIYQKDIEKMFRMEKSTLAAMLKTMEEKGYIRRLGVKGDARLKKVCLAEAGFACIEKLEKAKEALDRKIMEGLSKEEVEIFFRIIRHMQGNLNA